MSPQALSFDVTEAVGSGESLSQTARLFLPGDPARATAVLVCLAGGTYDKRYWHLEVPGHRGYSFAEHLAEQGYLVVALDHLGTGGSSDPQRSGSVGLRMLAAGDAEAVAQLSARLRDGTLVPGLPPLRLAVIGVGHSMGSCLTTMVAAQASPYDAVALLGYGVQVSNVLDEADGGGDLAARMNQSEAVFRQLNGVGPDEVSCVVPREQLRQLFHAPDVPGDVIAADDAAESRVPVRAASEVITPGYVAEFAGAVDVPVFLALGSHVDVSPDPYTEVANYRASRDVTLYVVEGSAHCHNFSGGRIALWDRMAAWIASVVAPESVLTAERAASRA
jgi:alpha-beta hydrolase superfamily lysophospholipase